MLKADAKLNEILMLSGAFVRKDDSRWVKTNLRFVYANIMSNIVDDLSVTTITKFRQDSIRSTLNIGSITNLSPFSRWNSSRVNQIIRLLGCLGCMKFQNRTFEDIDQPI